MRSCVAARGLCNARGDETKHGELERQREIP
jgi:hypothetical protein